MKQLLHASGGELIAFRRDPGDRCVFDSTGQWYGWIANRHGDVVNAQTGQYGATVVGDRLMRRTTPSPPLDHTRPSHPGHAGHPGHHRAQPVRLPRGFEDLPAGATFQYLFDYSGTWRAFRVQQMVFAPDRTWLGWTPYADEHVYTPDGEYLMSIAADDRVLVLRTPPPHRKPNRPHIPSTPHTPHTPTPRSGAAVPGTAADVA